MNQLKDCRHGRMLFNEHDVYIGRSLLLYGEFSEGECDVFKQIVQPGWSVVELGANIGAHTVFLAKCVAPTGKVLAFEPQRIVFQNLCANVSLNSLTNVDCRQLAVGESAGKVFVPWLDYTKDNNFGGLALGEYKQGEVVSVVSLDDLGLTNCHFIKIDIEGMELQAIRGAVKTIERFKPILYVENDREDRSHALVNGIDSLGYAMYWHTPPLFNPGNFFSNSNNVFGAIVSRNMICIPKSMAHNIDGVKVVVPGG